MIRGWQIYALAAFGVIAGQALRVGRKIESGQAVGWRDLAVMISLLPAFGAMIGAAAEHYGSPTWLILATGVSAGWIGVGSMRFVLAIVRATGAQILGATEPPKDD